MIETWAPELTSILEGVTGVKQVHPYDKLPGKIGVNGSVIWLPVSGPELTYGLSTPNIQITQVQITLYLTVQLLPQGVGKAIPFIDRIPRALAANMTLNGKLITFCQGRMGQPGKGQRIWLITAIRH